MKQFSLPLTLLTKLHGCTGPVLHLLCSRHVSLLSKLKNKSPITITEAQKILTDMVGVLYEGKTVMPIEGVLPIRDHQKDCPVRFMKDSYQEVIIPLGTCPTFRRKYLSFVNGLRFGRILEDLDTFASLICYTHNQDPGHPDKLKSSLCTVTALVDKIEVQNAISPFEDVLMRGHISWVGTSSMEVIMVVEQEEDRSLQQKLIAHFLMVARNPITRKSAVVNPLKPIGQLEAELYQQGEHRKVLRHEEGKKSLFNSVPSERERAIIHQLFLETIDVKSGTFTTRLKPEHSKWMESTNLKSIIICHPESRNLYNKIFGGFLMRQAFELAWANAALYCKGRPSINVVNDIVFRKPVEIGSLLFLSSQVVYTKGNLMQVTVHAEVLDAFSGLRETTNNFSFTFDSRQSELPHVMPRTYAVNFEAVWLTKSKNDLHISVDGDGKTVTMMRINALH